MLQNFMVECFSVAAVNNYELQERLKQLAKEIVTAPGEKDASKLFITQSKKLIPQYNYTGEEPPEGYLKTALRTAVTSAYHGNMWGNIQEAGIYNALQYKTMMDDNVREEHQRLEGRIYFLSDPIWSEIYPPNGWNCRCYVRPMTAEDIQGKKIETPEIPGSEGYKQTIKDSGVDKQFRRNSGETKSIWGKWLTEKLSDKNYEEIANRMKGEINKVPPAEILLKQLNSNAVEFIEPLSAATPKELKAILGDKVTTPIGEFVFGNDFYNKIFRRERTELTGLILPTLENPEIIFVDKVNATLFLKAFENKDGVTNYAGILKVPNGKSGEIVISFYEKENLRTALESGKLLIYSAAAQPAGSGLHGKELASMPGQLKTNIKSKNSKVNVENPQEIWGRTLPPKYKGEEYLSVIRKIYYGVDGVNYTDNNGSTMLTGVYSDINNIRRGVLLNAK